MFEPIAGSMARVCMFTHAGRALCMGLAATMVNNAGIGSRAVHDTASGIHMGYVDGYL